MAKEVNRKPVSTKYDAGRPDIRAALVKRIVAASAHAPVAILLTVANMLEEWAGQSDGK